MGDRDAPVRLFRFMSANQACFPAATMARVLGVSKAGYYAWRQRPPSRHVMADAALLKRVRTVHGSSRQTYGASRVRADLQGLGERHGRNLRTGWSIHRPDDHQSFGFLQVYADFELVEGHSTAPREYVFAQPWRHAAHRMLPILLPSINIQELGPGCEAGSFVGVIAGFFDVVFGVRWKSADLQRYEILG